MQYRTVVPRKLEKSFWREFMCLTRFRTVVARDLGILRLAAYVEDEDMTLGENSETGWKDMQGDTSLAFRAFGRAMVLVLQFWRIALFGLMYWLTNDSSGELSGSGVWDQIGL